MVVTAIDNAALGMPVVDRLEVTLLHECHAHIGVVNANLGGNAAHLRPHGWQRIKEVVALAFEKLDVKVLVPGEFLEAHLKLVVKEEVQTLG